MRNMIKRYGERKLISIIQISMIIIIILVQIVLSLSLDINPFFHLFWTLPLILLSCGFAESIYLKIRK